MEPEDIDQLPSVPPFIPSNILNNDDPPIIVNGSPLTRSSIPPIPDPSSIRSPLPVHLPQRMHSPPKSIIQLSSQKDPISQPKLSHSKISHPNISSHKPIDVAPQLSNPPQNPIQASAPSLPIASSITKEISVPKQVENKNIQDSIKRALSATRITPSSKRQIDYIKIKSKYQELQDKNKDGAIPNLPDNIEYDDIVELYNIHHKRMNYTKNIKTWHMIMMVMFFIVELIAKKLGFKCMNGFTSDQITLIQQFNDIIEDMGDAPLISKESKLPPFVKLCVLLAVNIITFAAASSLFDVESSRKMRQSLIQEFVQGKNVESLATNPFVSMGADMAMGMAAPDTTNDEPKGPRRRERKR